MVKLQAPKLRLCRRIGVLNELISLAYQTSEPHSVQNNASDGNWRLGNIPHIHTPLISFLI